MTNVLATRQDLQLLLARMDAGFALAEQRHLALRGEMQAAFSSVRREFQLEISTPHTGLQTAVSSLRAET